MRVFISYSKVDQKFVDRLCSELEVRGVDVWRDSKDIQVGDSIVEKIEEGIERSQYFCLVLSEASVERSWILREYRTALNRQLATNGKAIRILPLHIDNCQIPELLRDIKYANFSRSFLEGLDSLLSALSISNKRKIPYYELVHYIETELKPLKELIEAWRQGELEKLYEDCAYEFLKLTWDAVNITKMELEEYIKLGTKLVQVRQLDLAKENETNVQVIFAPPLRMFSGPIEYAPDKYRGYHGFTKGFPELLEILLEWRKKVLKRKIFVLPKSCAWDHERIRDSDLEEWVDSIDLKRIVDSVQESPTS